MSHIVQIQTEVRNVAAVKAACDRLRLSPPKPGVFRLFSTNVEGWAVELPGWRYPAVCDLATGQVHFDTYEGRWGKPEELDRWLQGYAVEVAKIEARKRGHSVVEQTLMDGSIKLVIQVGG
ncbi:MAG TPA: DUF1257 domain-containing protein [Pirellulales bacterium]